MATWNRCAICGRAIPVGELCYEIKNWRGDPDGGDTICRDCLVPENAPTLTPPNEWVSVEERLPEESDGMVLFTNGKAVTSGYRNHMFRMSGEEGIYAPAIRKGGGYMRVTHWMPLPEPPGSRLEGGEQPC